MDENSAGLHLSAVSVAEIEGGIAKLRREGARRRAADLAAWLETLVHLYATRILPFDLKAARLAGSLSDHARGRGQQPGFADVAIAATAQARGLVILTRNARHFETLGVPFLNPFDGPPPRRVGRS